MYGQIHFQLKSQARFNLQSQKLIFQLIFEILSKIFNYYSLNITIFTLLLIHHYRILYNPSQTYQIIYSTSMKSHPKTFTLRSAEELINLIVQISPALYRSFIKLLDQWQRNEQDKQTYQKLQQLLKNQQKVIQVLNVHLEEDIQLKPQKTCQQLVEEFLIDLKNTNKKAFSKAFQKINQLKAEGIDDENTINQELIQTFKDQPQINKRLQQILNQPLQKEKEKIQTNNKRKKQKPAVNIYENYYKKRLKYQELYEEDKNKTAQNATTYSNPNEQIFSIQKLENLVSKKQYESLIKVIHLYQIGILSKIQILNLVPQKLFQSTQTYQIFKDSIDSRQSERRKQTNLFKPLTELNYSQSERTTHSYVKMPIFYPIKCSGKDLDESLNELLNVKWVIVPIGSEHTSFNIRAKNPFEQLLLKSEDQRYEYDLNLYRYKQTLNLLQKIQLIQNDQEAQNKLNQVLRMGVIQNIYKNASKEQKEQIEVNLKANRIQMTQIVIQRLAIQIKQLQYLRTNNGLKLWHQNSQKNYYKSLDRRCFEFKKHERQFTKTSKFIQQLDTITENKKKPSILNTFEGLSKTEYVHNNKKINLQFEENNENNPFLIMYFENKYIKQLLIRLINAYIDAQPNNFDKQNLKKMFFQDFIMKYLLIQSDYEQPLQQLNYEVKIQEINQYLPIKKQIVNNFEPEYNFQIPSLKTQQIKSNKKQSNINEYQNDNRIKILLKESNIGYLPKPQKNNLNSLIYGSQSIYCFFRLFYIIYERILRAYELCYTFQQNENFKKLSKQQRFSIGEKRFELFIHIFNISLKNKQNSKFQQYLKQIFGEASYIFFSLIKLFQNLVKVALTCLSQQFTLEILRLFNQDKIQCQQIYMHLVNKISLNVLNSGRLFRLTYQQNMLHINYFNSIYKGWFTEKKDKQSFNFEKTVNKVEHYMLSKKNLLQVNVEETKKKYQSLVIKNNIQYTCIPKSLKLISRNEDFLLRKRKQLVLPVKKSHQLQLKRINKILQHWQNIQKNA